MLKNYFKVAIRDLCKHKMLASINVGGLAVGIACCLLLFLYVEQEWSYDRFHEDGYLIFRVVYDVTEPDGEVTQHAKAPPLLAPELEATFPEIEGTVRLARKTIRVSSTRLTDEEQPVEFADPALFEVFSFPLRQGDPRSALSDPGHVVLSDAAARKYFGEADPLGQQLMVALEAGAQEFTVVGVLHDVPEHSSLQFHVLLPYVHLPNDFSAWFRQGIFESWSMPLPMVETYVRLGETVDASRFDDKLPAFVEAAFGDRADGRALRVQPLAEIHLSPDVVGGMEPTSDPLYAYLLTGIALLVLGIACINFVTLMLGRSVERAREVGVRKVVGANRRQIRYQFWGEALLTTSLALLAGLALAELFLPTFNTLAGRSLTLGLLERPTVWLAAAGLIGAIGLLAGAYPAFMLSRFRPAAVLKGSVGIGGRQGFTRLLVTMQFALSIGLLGGALVMSQQLDYLVEKNLGFNAERIVVLGLNGTDDSEALYEALKQEARRQVAVEEITGAFFSFGQDGLDVEMQVGNTSLQTVHLNPVDSNYLDVMDIDLLRGRGLRAIGNAREVLVNETFVRTLGWDDPIGQELPVYEEASFASMMKGMTIAGVVEDFHVESLHTPIEPLILVPRGAIGNGVMAVLARVRPKAEAEALALLEATWHQLAPEKPFSYDFLEDVVAGQYENERRWRAIVGYATGFVLLIACLGLFGLAALAASQRTKEIGIRKVLGASVTNLIVLLSRDFLWLVFVAAVVAGPLAYLALDWWLAHFAYRIDLGALPFVLAGILALTMAFLTVSYQAVRAALADPVESLRYE